MKIKLKLCFILVISAVLSLAGCSHTEEAVIEDKPAKASKGTVQVSDNQGSNEIAFSLEGYFYSDSVELEIQSSKPCEIYYTTDGTEPDKKQKRYNNAIVLTATSQVEASCIKAKAYFEDGTESKVITHTYFVGNDVDKRFDTLVFSVTTAPYNLYDYEYGIFVEGKLREDYVKLHPNEKINPDAPANYNMRGRDSEREVYLEILEPDGTEIASQAAGIRTYGGWSRANLQKSIKIYTRKDYNEEKNKLTYEFFPQKTSADGDSSKLDSFNRLVLRDCGNDNGFAFIRDELFQTLAGQAGYQDYEAVRPVTLFINGVYQGFLWLHEVYDDEYFKENYGKYKGSFEVLEGGELYKTPDVDSNNEQTISEYQNMYNTYANSDLTDDVAYNELRKQIDVENYLSYYALQIYIGNEDWPHNNYKTYRYYTVDGESYKKAPFDGKWRYLLNDLDFSFGIYGTGPLVDNIGNYVGEDGEIRDICPLFGQLMKREDCKEYFIKKTCDLINGAFAPDNINKVLDEMNTSRMNELTNMYGKNLMADWVQLEQLAGRLNDIRSYGTERAEHIIMKYQEYFGLGDIYTLDVQPADGCKVKINSFLTDSYFEGRYYSDYNTDISAALPEGKEIDYWLVNGEQVYEKELTITP
ncbi:MAG TPA: CotH kinase family protein, partial [Mobilitalea sp.]|nr:CotH kinase family protein [Mobilitalea sp.]